MLRQEATISKDERRYSETEFALIVRKALELQEHPPGARLANPADGLTLADIKAAAGEVGLDPSLIDRAAAILPETTVGRAARIFGGPDKYRMEYTAPGVLSKEDFGRVIDAVRKATGNTGKVSDVLGSLEWETVGWTSPIHVTVSPREGETTIKVMADRGPTGVIHFGVIGMVGSLISIGIAGAIIQPDTLPGVVGLVAACLTGGFLTARTFWTTTGKGYRSILRNLMAGASKAIDDSVKPSQLPGDYRESP